VLTYESPEGTWRITRFGAFVSEMGVEASALPDFHEAACVKARGWQAVRRLFGMMPLLPAPDFPQDDLRVWSREELQSAWGLTRAQLQGELDAVRGHWQGISGHAAPAAAPAPVSGPAPELPLVDEMKELADLGFPDIKFASSTEKDWFVRRAREWGRALTEKVVSDLARDALMTVLQIRRLEEILQDPARSRVGSEDWRANMRLKREFSTAYQALVEQISKLFPWVTQVSGKVSLQGMLSEITLAMQNIAARGDSTLADGIFTALEIQVLCRRAVQAPDPAYRAGLVVYLNAAKAHMLDPHWQCKFSPGQLRRLDAAWKAAFVAAAESDGERMVDLESDGKDGEYPALVEG
jgi:hypothetical protein